MPSENQMSCYAKIFGGRSIFSIIFGQFFEVKNNTAGIVASALVLTLCYVVISKIDQISNLDKIVEGVLNIIFVVVGYYFGAKQTATTKPEDDG